MWKPRRRSAACRAWPKRPGCVDRVTFVGRRRRSQLCHFYCASDVFVTTPWYEPFGITPVEAMACGVPVVGAGRGGIRSTVVDGETGYLVPARAPEALADRLARLACDGAMARRMGMAGLRRAHASYTWMSVARTMEQVYARVTPTQRPARRAAA
ncbi:glycosyltransferase [Cupriavidus basilensis]